MYSDAWHSHHYPAHLKSNFWQPNNGRRASMEGKGQNRNDEGDIQQALGAVVERSRVLGVKREEGGGWGKTDREEAAKEKAEEGFSGGPSSSTSSSTSPLSLLLDRDPSSGLLPPFDLLTHLPPSVQCRKFFADLRPLDRVLARVVRPGIAVLHVELVCMLTRFRRVLSFLKGKLIPVPFDRTKRFYQVNDYISTTVVSIAPNSEELELELDEEEAILTQQGIPAYCRDFDRTSSFDDCPHISTLRDNPNLAAQMGVRIDSVHSGIRSLCAKNLELAPGAEQLRREQTARLAMVHVKKGAELTRANKCFEAIQCFNKALNVDPECADAYVGRGAACAGNRNFPAALQDLEKAIELQPAHRNANKYRLEVMFTYGKELARSGDVNQAREKFERVLELCPGHQGAVHELQMLGPKEGTMTREVIDLSDEEEGEVEELEEGGRRRSGGGGGGGRMMSSTNGQAKKRKRSENTREEDEEEVQRNRQKLAEMEAFIAKLKKGTGPKKG